MKSYSYLLFAILMLLTFSCTDGITDTGSQIQPEGDKISVDTATVYLETENYFPEFMYSRPDSFLLGTFVDPFYGTTYADILAQVQPPLDFSYPAGAQADSAKLVMYYYNWFGHQYSPMEVNVYKMNKGLTFNYTNAYRSDIDVSLYTDRTERIGKKSFSAKDAVIIRPDTTAIEIKLTDSFVQNFSSVLSKRYTQSNQSEFQSFFNGIYVTTNFGTASMLYLRGLAIKYYFHYSYITKDIKGQDSTAYVNSYVPYPANSEVRQVNRFQHPDRESLKATYNADDQVTYLSSPTNIYTKVSVPLRKLGMQLKVNDKILLLNRAKLRVDVNELNEDDLAQPITSRMLLVKESAYNRFFQKHELPSDTCAILTSYSSETDEDTEEVNYYYSFDLAGLIINEIRNKDVNDLPETMNFILMPVTLQYNGSSSVIEVKPQNLMSATKINSGKHKTKPMKIDVVYSKF
ncbi:MAG: hypothetical protein H6Q20_126 [Bacteroidetes bacterium]|nr:hypothetical protein [Bacteroidota bacterium]